MYIHNLSQIKKKKEGDLGFESHYHLILYNVLRVSALALGTNARVMGHASGLGNKEAKNRAISRTFIRIYIQDCQGIVYKDESRY